MTTTQTTTAYDLRGDLIEACSCMGPCPCWVGDDPDDGRCNSFTGYHFNSGTARGVDVSGITTVSLVQIPGNVADGNWREVMFISDNATNEQQDALMDALQGRLGGPLADLAALITDRVATHKVPIEYTIANGTGVVKVGHPSGQGFAIDAIMEPYRGPDGEPTKLVNSSWNTIPGNEALVGKASHNKIALPEHQMEWAYEKRNSIQGLDFHLFHKGD